ncbi:arginine deiminase-related protein [Streptomyces somaliensis DSM 40738]|uniref:Amidinotransferase n=1 Tax=Streptomyces somaliensis (strain ATCC 33201 / DSM 40738 / JCM 12659 / KCTC 9044 / NCTC 11332 / NRRL B-12077 / IP 733) TaxID=1134445 RepID=A0AA44DH60_STRE0|nr:dimethylargininase [Streptomyces somaliensis]MCQ0025269.1 arginine deiminase-related protein [Streptomyces somaliensis DSM 40738]NKY16197.1 amidinotransferase [Streptomyces somaliensis DSM 40738]
MCEPRYFDVRYAINPWMNPEDRVDLSLARDQWHNLVQVYRDHGHTVETVTPVEGLPDMVFAANAALVVDGRVLGSSFHAPERQPEAEVYAAWFKEAGYDVHQTSAVCEGEGDLVPTGRYVLAGTGFRTQRAAHHEAQEFFGTPVIGLQLVDPRFYHLDTALFLLREAGGEDDATGAGNVAYYPGAFSPGSREVLRRLFPQAVIASEEDALTFGLNSVSDGHHVFIDPRAQGLIDQLADRGYVPVPVDLSEFRKSGGGIKCCTQEIR